VKVADRTSAEGPLLESAPPAQEVSRTELEVLEAEAQWSLAVESRWSLAVESRWSLAVRELEQVCLAQRLSSLLGRLPSAGS